MIRSDNSSRYVVSEEDLLVINAMIEEDADVSLGEIFGSMSTDVISIRKSRRVF